MSNERPDEFLSWRTKLTQPDALPEQGLDDPESAWQQLYTRLGEKPRRRLFYWYAAAACLLLALIPAVLLFRDRPSPVKHSAGQLARQPAKQPDKALRQESARPASSPHPDRPSTARTDKVLLHPARSGRSRPPSLLDPSANLVSLDPVNTVSAPIDLPPPTGQVPQLAQQPPVRRTLRVVSINELDNPPPSDQWPRRTVGAPLPSGALSGFRTSVPVKIRLQSDKGLTRQVAADRAEDPQFLQLKISLQNP